MQNWGSFSEPQVANQATQTELEKAIEVNTNLQEWYKKLQTALDLNRDQMIKQQHKFTVEAQNDQCSESLADSESLFLKKRIRF